MACPYPSRPGMPELVQAEIRKIGQKLLFLSMTTSEKRSIACFTQTPARGDPAEKDFTNPPL